jgi:hypothetical protein
VTIIGRLDGTVRVVLDTVTATPELRMLLAEAGRPDLADALQYAGVGSTDSFLLWAAGVEQPPPPVVWKAVDLFRLKRFPNREETP